MPDDEPGGDERRLRRSAASRSSCSAAPAATAGRPTARGRTRSTSCRARATCATTAFVDSVDDRRLFESILYGVQGTAMPPWIDYGLTQNDVGDMVNFIRSINPKTQGATQHASKI